MNTKPVIIYRFLFTLRAMSRIEFNDFPGIAIRGGLGLMLKKMACVIDAGRVHSCASCPLCASCPYALIFETPPPEDAPVMKKATHCPHPFSISPLFPATSAFERGECMHIALSLFGDTLKHLAPIAGALAMLGRCGIGRTRGKFNLEGITNLADGSVVPTDGVVSLAAAMGFPSAERGTGVNRIKVTFLTPCRLVHERKPVTCAEIGVIGRSVARRLSLLAHFYGGEAGSVSFNETGLEGIQKEIEQLSHVTSVRYSTRRRIVMPLDGFTGYAVWSGALDGYYALLKQGEAVGVGKNTSFGFGAIRVEDVSAGAGNA